MTKLSSFCHVSLFEGRRTVSGRKKTFGGSHLRVQPSLSNIRGLEASIPFPPLAVPFLRPRCRKAVPTAGFPGRGQKFGTSLQAAAKSNRMRTGCTHNPRRLLSGQGPARKSRRQLRRCYHAIPGCPSRAAGRPRCDWADRPELATTAGFPRSVEARPVVPSPAWRRQARAAGPGTQVPGRLFRRGKDFQDAAGSARNGHGYRDG